MKDEKLKTPNFRVLLFPILTKVRPVPTAKKPDSRGGKQAFPSNSIAFTPRSFGLGPA